MIELTEEQQRDLDAANGTPIVVDRRTNATYVLVRSEEIERQKPPVPAIDASTEWVAFELPEGIRRSKAALRRDLPKLLGSRWTRGRWVCYHLEKRIAVSRDYLTLIRECNRLNIPNGESIIERITPGAGSEEEIEIETPDV